VISRKQKFQWRILWIYVLERLFDFASSAVIAGVRIIFVRVAGTCGRAGERDRERGKDGGVLLAVGVAARSRFWLTCGCMAGGMVEAPG